MDTATLELPGLSIPAKEEHPLAPPPFVEAFSAFWRRTIDLDAAAVSAEADLGLLHGEVSAFQAGTAWPKSPDGLDRLDSVTDSGRKLLDKCRYGFLEAAAKHLGGIEPAVFEKSSIEMLDGLQTLPIDCRYRTGREVFSRYPSGGFQKAWFLLAMEYGRGKGVESGLKSLRARLAKEFCIRDDTQPTIDEKGRLVLKSYLSVAGYERIRELREVTDALEKFARHAGIKATFDEVNALKAVSYDDLGARGTFPCGPHFSIRLLKSYLQVTVSPTASESFRIFMAEFATPESQCVTAPF